MKRLKKLRLSVGIAEKLLILLVLASSITLYRIVPSVQGAANEIRVINPATDDTNFEFYTNTTFVEDRFNVTVYVYDVTDLITFQVCLKYNSTVLDPTGAWISEDDPKYIFYEKESFAIGPEFYHNDQRYGTSVLVGGALQGEVDGVNGTGLLAIIEFKIIEKPDVDETLSCNFDIDNATITFLWDSQYNDIEATRTNGHYQYTWTPPLAYLVVEPQVYHASELETFNITIWLNNTASDQRLVYVRFSLCFSAILLNVTKVIEGDFLAGFGSTSFNHSITTGCVTIENNLTIPSSFPQGDGEIAIITFQGIHQGTTELYCPLEFIDTQFLNDLDEAVSIIPNDGHYTIAKTTGEITINVYSDNWVKREEQSEERYIVVAGSNVTISGTIDPPEGGENVEIICKSSDNTTRWNVNSMTDSNGHYMYNWTTGLENLGALLKFEAVWRGEAQEEIAESGVWSYLGVQYLEVRIEEESQITISVDPETVAVGGKVTIEGTIQPSGSAKHANVTIKHRLANETVWSVLAETQPDSTGKYTHTWTAEKNGTYKIKAVWPGDLPLVTGSESAEATVNVVETLPVDFMAYVPYVVGGIAVIIVIAIIYFIKIRKH